jgi:sugar phosphate isomerase/epimerase
LNDRDFLLATREALGRAGIPVLEVSNLVLDETFRAEEAETFVAFAAAVGARLVQVVGWDQSIDRTIENLAAVADLAADVGLDVVLEFMPYSETRTLDDALRTVMATGRRNVRLLLDSLHLFRSGGDVASVAAADPEYFAVIQLSDAPLKAPDPVNLRAESRTSRLVPGAGELPLHELMAVLPKDLPISLEVPCLATRGLSFSGQAAFVMEGFRRFLAEETGPHNERA